MNMALVADMALNLQHSLTVIRLHGFCTGGHTDFTVANEKDGSF